MSKSRGVTTNLTRGQFFIRMLKNQFDDRLSDDELANRMKKEFPEVHTDFRARISYYRNLYNRGGWSIQAEAPTVPVPKFEDGEPVDYDRKPGPSPRLSWEKKEKRVEQE